MLFLNVVDPVNYHHFVLLFKYYRMDCMICRTFFFFNSCISIAGIIIVLKNMEKNFTKSSIMEQSVWKE